MALSSVFAARLPNLFRSVFIQHSSTQLTYQRLLNVSAVDLAARKGTREKARKKKVKVEVKKMEFIPKKLRVSRRFKVQPCDKHISDEFKHEIPNTNAVYPKRFFKRHLNSIEDVVKMIRETHSPTMFNAPNALVNIRIELNIEMLKKNRFMDNFNRTALLPYPFQVNEERKILVFCKDLDIQKKLIDAGATMAGGTEIIKDIQTGDLKLFNFDYILAHGQILTDIIPLRGLLKKRFPNEKSGTLGNDIVSLVKKFISGTQYRSKKDDIQKNFAEIVSPIGKLDMEASQLEANIKEFINDVNVMRPNRPGTFVSKCYITSPPSIETFQINPYAYIEAPVRVATAPSATNDADSDSDDENEKEELAEKA